ncbi:unnamed protein product, partial [marine sediment metagenome]
DEMSYTAGTKKRKEPQLYSQQEQQHDTQPEAGYGHSYLGK